MRRNKQSCWSRCLPCRQMRARARPQSPCAYLNISTIGCWPVGCAQYFCVFIRIAYMRLFFIQCECVCAGTDRHTRFARDNFCMRNGFASFLFSTPCHQDIHIIYIYNAPNRKTVLSMPSDASFSSL